MKTLQHGLQIRAIGFSSINTTFTFPTRWRGFVIRALYISVTYHN
jgi:hypothetical protein